LNAGYKGFFIPLIAMKNDFGKVGVSRALGRVLFRSKEFNALIVCFAAHLDPKTGLHFSGCAL